MPGNQGNDALNALLPVIAALDRLDVPYYVGGSLASSAHGVMRASVDADLVADLRPQHVDGLVEALRAGYYIDANMIRGALAARSCFNLIHLATSFKVDIFVLKGRPYDRAALARKERRSIDPDSPEAQVFLATPEDTVLAKLEWYRLGNEVSDRQWIDILGVLKLQRGRLDLDYMKKWAAALKVADLLERAMQQASGPNA
jgi:hypothetical protein